MITSKLTSKAQTTVPLAVRKALGLKPGDRMVYKIEDGQVILTREGEAKPEDPFGSFEEWRTENDEEAYADL